MAAVLVLAVVAVSTGLVRLPSGSGPASPPPPVPAGSTQTQGRPGLGDPYYPRAGNSGYDVARYTIAVSWDPARETLSGTTTVSAHAEHQLDSFYLDLALTARSVSVDGVPARFERRGADLRVRPAQPVVGGADFDVEVSYAGQPGKVGQQGARPWRQTGQEWTAAGEPEVAAWWFPANDHPSDPALMDVSVRVPAGLEAVSVGRLESRDTGNEPGYDTWHWVAGQPMAPFLNFVTIGQYELREGTENGVPYLYAVSEQLSREQRRAAFDQLLTSGATVRALESLFGPYPFSDLGGVVPAHPLPFGGLENQTRPVYNARSILNPRFAPGLITHELAHMWFGDQVTVRQWDDIFLSEAYASWAQWASTEQAGGTPAQAVLLRVHDRIRGRADFWRVRMIDPGREHLFDAVYTRGPMTLQALRQVIGEEAFTALNREWAAEPGSRSLEDWMARAQTYTPVDLGPFFQAWIYAPTAPARTAANGLG